MCTRYICSRSSRRWWKAIQIMRHNNRTTRKVPIAIPTPAPVDRLDGCVFGEEVGEDEAIVPNGLEGIGSVIGAIEEEAVEPVIVVLDDSVEDVEEDEVGDALLNTFDEVVEPGGTTQRGISLYVVFPTTASRVI